MNGKNEGFKLQKCDCNRDLKLITVMDMFKGAQLLFICSCDPECMRTYEVKIDEKGLKSRGKLESNGKYLDLSKGEI